MQTKTVNFRLLETKGILEQFALASYEYGRYSPKYGNVSNIMPGIEILDETEDSKILQESRAKNKRNESGEQLDGEEHMIDIAKKGMTNDEVQFSVEETLEKQHFLWSDKYRPRKPRYFNRVIFLLDFIFNLHLIFHRSILAMIGINTIKRTTI